MSAAPCFAIFPIEFLQHNLTALELRVLIALYSFRGKTTNTVWPSRSELAARAAISDESTVSKVLGRLESKGFLTKRKRGFTGGNVYELTAPDDLPIVDKTSTMDDSPNMDKPPTPNVDKTSTSNVDDSSTNKELTNEQTNEQTKKHNASLSLLLAVEGMDKQVAIDWLAVRRDKGAPTLTPTAMKKVVQEAAKAKLPVVEAIRIAVEKGWRGFEAAWLLNNPPLPPRTPPRTPPRPDNFDGKDYGKGGKL